MTRKAPRTISWKTIREKVPYESRTRRSDRAGKTRTPLLEMRTAPLETATAKSMRLNDKKQILLRPKFVFSKMSHRSEHSESEFLYPELLHQSPTHSESKERNLTLLVMKKLTTFSEANKQTGDQGNNFSG